MDDTVSARKQAVVGAAVAEGLVGDERLIAGFVDLQGIEATVAALKAAFADHFLHTFAAKANCLLPVLAGLRDLGIGSEVASLGELQQARRVGFTAEMIIFDSPAKTRAEIRLALDLGVCLNIDNFQELERVAALVDAGAGSRSVIGFRINPQVGVGTIAAMSTATRTSKFGVALDDGDNRQRLIETYRRHPWLTCLHVHVGSQGCPLELIVEGIRKAMLLAAEIDRAAGGRRIEALDIGGGLPVNFETDSVRPAFADYARMLRDHVPDLFSGRYRIVTEFGRSIMAKNGFIVAKVEYTKRAGGKHIAITHAGAQVATRTVFMPEAWAIRISAFDRNGTAKSGPKVAQDVAGPCCFAGDIIAHDRALPLLEPDDLILAHDTGAYYFSTPFQYNSLPRPAVYGFRISEGDEVRFETLRAEETIDQVVAATAGPAG